jgi:hypothetical protein
MVDDPKAAAGAAVTKIDAALLELASLEALVTSFSSEKQAAVEESFLRSAEALKDVDQAANALQGTEVPVKLLDWVDQGKDPDAFFKQLFQETIWNAQVCGLPCRVCIRSVAVPLHTSTQCCSIVLIARRLGIAVV